MEEPLTNEAIKTAILEGQYDDCIAERLGIKSDPACLNERRVIAKVRDDIKSWAGIHTPAADERLRMGANLLDLVFKGMDSRAKKEPPVDPPEDRHDPIQADIDAAAALREHVPMGDPRTALDFLDDERSEDPDGASQ